MRGMRTASWRPPPTQGALPTHVATETQRREGYPSPLVHAFGRPTSWEISAIRSLGPRIKWSAVNTSEHQYNQTLYLEVTDPSHYQDYAVHRMLPNDNWPHRVTAQFLSLIHI